MGQTEAQKEIVNNVIVCILLRFEVRLSTADWLIDELSINCPPSRCLKFGVNSIYRMTELINQLLNLIVDSYQ